MRTGHLLPTITGPREELRRHLRYDNTARATADAGPKDEPPERVMAKAKIWAR